MKTVEELEARLGVATRERDEARARLEETEHAMHMRIRAGYDACVADAWRAKVASVERERAEEVQRLTDERDELLVRVADQGAELRATRDAYGTAYRRGAEAMRDACVATIHDGGLVWTRESAERALREIGILEEP